MNVNEINAYLKQAREIIGERTQAETDYDNAVVASLGGGADIKRAIREANRQYPSEALNAGPDHWQDLAARYDYLLKHREILRQLGIKE